LVRDGFHLSIAPSSLAAHAGMICGGRDSLSNRLPPSFSAQHNFRLPALGR
jgi:hypothetical protein